MNGLPDFKLERYFAAHEFTARHLLSPSDCQSLSMSELLEMADAECRSLWQDLSLGYTESQGHPLLRQQIARLYQGLSAGNVLVGAPEECILVAMQALLRPGDQVIATHPGYQSLQEIARSLGCEVVRWELQPQAGGWQLDLGLLERAITRRTRLLVVNFPHNPTGFQPSSAWFSHLVGLARRHGAYLFSDEMYRCLEYDPAQRLPPACGLYDRAITLSGLSKAFSLPGLRIGWLATADRELLSDCSRIKDYTTICSSAPSEILAIIALRAGETIVARNLQTISRNLSLASGFFGADPARWEWLAPRAGSVAFPRLTTDEPIEGFCQRVLARQGLMIAPGSLFDYPGNHFRVGLGRTDFPAALEQLAGFLAPLKG